MTNEEVQRAAAPWKLFAEATETLKAIAEIAEGAGHPCTVIRRRALAMVQRIEDSNGK